MTKLDNLIIFRFIIFVQWRAGIHSICSNLDKNVWMFFLYNSGNFFIKNSQSVRISGKPVASRLIKCSTIFTFTESAAVIWLERDDLDAWVRVECIVEFSGDLANNGRI